MSDDTFFLELYKYHTHDFHPGERTKGLVNKSLINKHPSGARAGAEITTILLCGSCNFSFLKNSLVQINSKLNSKPYDYLY